MVVPRSRILHQGLTLLPFLLLLDLQRARSQARVDSRSLRPTSKRASSRFLTSGSTPCPIYQSFSSRGRKGSTCWATSSRARCVFSTESLQIEDESDDGFGLSPLLQNYDPSFLTPADLDVYVRAYSQAGGIRAGLGVYRAFSHDKADFEKSFATKGRIKLPCLTLTSEGSAFTPQVTKQTHEYAEDATFASIPHANHYIPEENPKAFVEAVSEWLESKIPRR